MPTYRYVALSREGTRVRATAEAASQPALTRSLFSEGLVVLRMREASAGSGGRSRRPLRVPQRQLLEATRSLASLLGAGMPLARALSTTRHVADTNLRAVLDEVRTQVERGASFATALESFPTCFNPMYTGMIRAGERSGDLSAAMVRLTQHLERNEALRARLLSASIYPLLLASAGGIAVTILMTLVLPRFAELLIDTGAILPRSTTMLITISESLQESWLLVLGLAAAFGVMIAAGCANDDGRRLLGRIVLRMPLIGALRTLTIAGRFARMTSVLMIGGATLYAALEDVANSLGDILSRDEMQRIRAKVREGSSLSGALSTGRLFPPLLTQLVLVGEESGALERFLDKAADVFEERADRTRQRLVAFAEPAMIIVFGGIVGFVALSMLQAVYSVNASAFR
jgi:type II secretory pathway component PulF